jgi:hypothetical protein
MGTSGNQLVPPAARPVGVQLGMVKRVPQACTGLFWCFEILNGAVGAGFNWINCEALHWFTAHE